MFGNLLRRKGKAEPVGPDGGQRRIDTAPPGVVFHSVRARGRETVQAKIAEEDGITSDGLHYEAGRHYIVQYDRGDRAPVDRRVFERTYKRRFDGKYEKRRDLVLHYFTLPYAVIVETLEGEKIANAGDWIMRGVLGELYPMTSEIGRSKYEPV
jgi:hypothetical protein